MRKQLNLNPKSIERNNKSNKGIVFTIIYIGILFILLIDVGLREYNNNNLKKQKSILESKILSCNNLNINVEDIKNEINEKKAFINNVSALENKVKASQYIEEIGNYVPKSIKINTINFNKDGLNIIGVTDKKNDVSVFLANLQMSNLFRNAVVNSINEIEVTTNTENEDNNTEINNDSKEKLNNKDKSDNKNDDEKIKDINSSNTNKSIKGIDKKEIKNKKTQFTISIKGEKENG